MEPPGRGAGLASGPASYKPWTPGLSLDLSGPHQENWATVGGGTNTVGGVQGGTVGTCPTALGNAATGELCVAGVAQRGQSPKALPKGLLPFPGGLQGTRSGRCPQGGLKPGRKSRGTGPAGGRWGQANHLKLEAIRVTCHSPPSRSRSLC